MNRKGTNENTSVTNRNMRTYLCENSCFKRNLYKTNRERTKSKRATTAANPPLTSRLHSCWQIWLGCYSNKWWACSFIRHVHQKEQKSLWGTCQMKYLTWEQVIKLHQALIETSGGSSGRFCTKNSSYIRQGRWKWPLQLPAHAWKN